MKMGLFERERERKMNLALLTGRSWRIFHQNSPNLVSQMNQEHFFPSSSPIFFLTRSNQRFSIIINVSIDRNYVQIELQMHPHTTNITCSHLERFSIDFQKCNFPIREHRISSLIRYLT